MDITSLIIEAVSGAVGGNVAGAAMKEKSLGAIGNSIAGIVGGGVGGTILQMVMGTAATGGGGMDLQKHPCQRRRRRRGRSDTDGDRRHHQEPDVEAKQLTGLLDNEWKRRSSLERHATVL
jgi:uncharacterized membrane protein YeaQ/YmgE (transglycosylase-associated protein family)